MAAILHQLFSAIPAVVHHALDAYRTNGEELGKLLDTMFNVLQDAASDPVVGQVLCVLDALDECDNRERIIDLITSFYRCSQIHQEDRQAKLKFFLTSLPYDDIQFRFRSLVGEARQGRDHGVHPSRIIGGSDEDVVYYPRGVRDEPALHPEVGPIREEVSVPCDLAQRSGDTDHRSERVDRELCQGVG